MRGKIGRISSLAVKINVYATFVSASELEASWLDI
jgi:hypothetical protein